MDNPKLADNYDELSLGAKALELWRFWFEFSGYPWILCQDDTANECFFCGAIDVHGKKHERYCPYVRVCELLGEKVQ